MDIYTIVSRIFKYSLLALGGIAALVPLYAAGFLIYKKVFHGTKKLQIGQWISPAVFDEAGRKIPFCMPDFLSGYFLHRGIAACNRAWNF